MTSNGFTPEDVRVSVDPMSLGSTIDVTIMRLGVRLDAIDRLAKKHLEIEVDAAGELLLGWNRHVDVRYARAALAPLQAEAAARIGLLKRGQSAELGSYVVTRSDVGWEVAVKHLPDELPRAFPSRERAARWVAQWVAASGKKSIP